MSAEILRRAASLMRERAEAATPGPWGNRRGPGEYVHADARGESPVAMTSTREDRRHIASWHPVVALAVADWLDRSAAIVESYDAIQQVPVISPDALNVARAYLGESA